MREAAGATSKKMKGHPVSEETRKKLSESHKGKNNPLYGKHHSEKTRNKLSEINKGKKMSEESKKKNREAHKGKCISEEHKNKLSEANKGNTHTKGKHWYNNGKISIMSKECPPGFIPGRIK